jgi:arginyl-tRNA--protein-N-Asp/Glu arginylyltransferase
MDYKSRFRPLEVLGASGWQRLSQDRPYEEPKPHVIPAPLIHTK